MGQPTRADFHKARPRGGQALQVLHNQLGQERRRHRRREHQLSEAAGGLARLPPALRQRV